MVNPKVKVFKAKRIDGGYKLVDKQHRIAILVFDQNIFEHNFIEENDINTLNGNVGVKLFGKITRKFLAQLSLNKRNLQQQPGRNEQDNYHAQKVKPYLKYFFDNFAVLKI
jgi:hypothetical protein